MDTDVINRACVKALASPFQWGFHDCCSFVCDVLDEVTGRDPMADLRGSYSSEEEALAALGVAGLVATVMRLASEQGFKRVEFPFVGAFFGLVSTPKGPAMALFLGDKWVARAETGILTMPLRNGFLAWALN
ncbi:MAG: hypothetical protein ABJA10_07540 [Aestuariivirga sp.]